MRISTHVALLYILSNQVVSFVLLPFKPCYVDRKAASVAQWALPSQEDNHDSRSTTTAAPSSILQVHTEVVGATGRLGSQMMRLGWPFARAVPRGLCPGCWTQQSSPIVVTTPAAAWEQIFHVTLPQRRQDLIFIGNGILTSRIHENATVVIPHYGILKAGASPTTIRDSPPTYIYGKHAQEMADLLSKDGISIQIVKSWSDVCLYSRRKLLWASCLWLLCHFHQDENNNPISVDIVHQLYESDLEQLVRELLPSFQENLETNMDERNVQETLDYMRQYSDSMPGAVPSLALASSELKERNGIFLKSKEQQPFHHALLETILGVDRVNDELLQSSQYSAINIDNLEVVPVAGTNISVYGPKITNNILTGPAQQPCVVVVGGGVLGSSVALSMARAGYRRITVLDAQPAEEQEGSAKTMIAQKTTPSSWAWLNANQKAPPPAYQWLNMMGMWTWHSDPILSHLPSWKGSLVKLAKPLDGTTTTLTGYYAEGPLTKKRILELEPLCIMDSTPSTNTEELVYHFPQEGCVDPNEMVRVLQEQGMSHNVTFLANHHVQAVTRDEEGKIVEILCQSPENKTFTIPVELVISAAGTGTEQEDLGGVPLMHSPPGTVLLGKLRQDVEMERGSNGDLGDSGLLKRILVDAVHETHMLQRMDGTLAIGGGYPQVGGASASKTAGSNAVLDATHLLSAASKHLAPSVVSQVSSHVTKSSERPMPEDGYPCVGFASKNGTRKGLYTVVTHSGITLAPILSALIATELKYGIDLDLLRLWRPQRFTTENSKSNG